MAVCAAWFSTQRSQAEPCLEICPCRTVRSEPRTVIAGFGFLLGVKRDLPRPDPVTMQLAPAQATTITLSVRIPETAPVRLEYSGTCVLLSDGHCHAAPVILDVAQIAATVTGLSAAKFGRLVMGARAAALEGTPLVGTAARMASWADRLLVPVVATNVAA